MSSFLSICSLLVFMLMIQSYTLVHSFRSFSSKIESTVLHDICSETENPSYCHHVLNSNPKIATTDLTGVCQIAIDLAHSNVASTYKELPSLISKKTNPRVYTLCDYGYNGAIGKLDNATSYLKSGDSMGVNLAAYDAMNFVGKCEDSFYSPDDVPAKLAIEIKNFHVLAQVTMTVAGLLTH